MNIKICQIRDPQNWLSLCSYLGTSIGRQSLLTRLCPAEDWSSSTVSWAGPGSHGWAQTLAQVDSIVMGEHERVKLNGNWQGYVQRRNGGRQLCHGLVQVFMGGHKNCFRSWVCTNAFNWLVFSKAVCSDSLVGITVPWAGPGSQINMVGKRIQVDTWHGRAQKRKTEMIITRLRRTEDMVVVNCAMGWSR
jgi:hypothetical protein